MVFRTTSRTCSNLGKATLIIVVMALWSAIALAGVNEDLLKATERGDLPAVKRLLVQEGAQVNAKNKDGDTALILAVRRGYRGTVQELLAKGAEVNVKNKDGHTALMFAAWRGDQGIVQDLLAKGAEVNVKGKSGATALKLASLAGHREVADLLARAGAK